MLALAALLLAIQISPWYYSQGDAPAYISIARHLAHGDGLRNKDSQVLWFPPGYPILLSPLFCWQDFPLLGISFVHWFLAVGFLLGIYRWARSLAPQGAVWIAAICLGTNAMWIHYRQPVSEMAFMAAMAWLLVSLQALVRPQGASRFLAWLAAAVGLTIAMCLIRSVGIAVAAGGSCALAASAVRSRFELNRPASKTVSWPLAMGAALLIGAAGLMTVGAVVVRERWVAQSLGAATYLTSLEARRGASILGSFGPWCALVVSDVGRITVPFMFKSYGYIGWWWDVNMLVYAPWCGLLCYGYLRWLRRSDDPLAWSLPFYFAVLTYFRWESGARWWVPMTPAFLMCLWFAMETWRGSRLRILRTLWLAHVLAALAYWICCDLPRSRSLDRKWPTVRSLAEQITVGRDQVVVDESLDDLAVLLGLQLDRRVKECSDDSPLPASAQWVVLPSKKKPPPGFVRQTCLDGCELLHRG